jgi:hypothetical protein
MGIFVPARENNWKTGKSIQWASQSACFTKIIRAMKTKEEK